MSRRTTKKPQQVIKKRTFLKLEHLEDRTLLDASNLLIPDAFMIAMMEQAARNVVTGQVTQTKGGITSTTESMGTYTRQWLVGLYPNTPAGALAGSLGAVSKGEAGLLRDAYVFEFNASDVRTAYDALSGQRSIGNIAYYFPLMSQQMSTEFVPNDTFYPQQWNLNNTGQSGGLAGQDARLQGAWDTARGLGVTIGIFDNGVQYTHPDLAANLSATVPDWDFVNNDNDAAPNTASDFHGTAVAGVIAAVGNNGLGVAGVAFQSKFVPIRLLAGESPVMPTDLVTSQAISYELQNIHVQNHSWGQNSTAYQAIMPLTQAAYANAATTGRAGKGAVIVRSAGNNNIDINYNTLRNSRYVISVGSVTDSGTRSTNSNWGAPLIVMAPSSRTTTIPSTVGPIYSTDIVGSTGYNGLADLNYTNRFGGTSTAAATVSGVVALMLQANPNLTYRDVQVILAQTARRNDPTNVDWVQNGAGRFVNHNYGFGVVDATAAVAAASTWVNLGTQITLTNNTQTVNLPIPDGNTTGVTVTANLNNSVPRIQWAEVEINIPNHTWRGDINIELTSPSGTKSILARTNGDSADGIVQTFTSFRYLGESSGGTWSLKVWDGVGADVGTLVSWKLNIYGDAPLIGVNDTYTTPEDTPLIVPLPGVLGNDIGALTAQLVSTTTRGALVFNTDGSFTYTPNADYNNTISGPDSFTYRPQNGVNLGALTTVTINITPVNDAPVAVGDGFPDTAYIVKPGQTINIPARGVLLNDTDIDTNPLTLTAIRTSSTFLGPSTLASNGAVTYTANAGSSGLDTFTYVAFDGQLQSNTVNVNFRVNTQPNSVNDSFNTIVGTGTSGNVLTNDTDFDLGPFQATLVATTPNGVLNLNTDGTFTYTPNAGFFGIDTFSYRADDPYYNPANPFQVGNVATVSIRVDRLPVANFDQFTIKKGTTLELFSPGLLVNDTDADIPQFPDVLQADLVSTTANGTLTFAANGYIKYVPNPAFSGVDTFSYRVTDGLFFGNTTTVSITVQNTPTAVADSYVSFGSVLVTGSPTGLLVNDLNPNGGPLAARLNSVPVFGTVTVNPDGSFVYTAPNGFAGTDTFTYIANDGLYDSEPGLVTIMVFDLNQPPVANDDGFATPANTPLNLVAPGVLQNDVDPNGDPLTATLVTGPTRGSLLLNANGSFSYQPNPGFQGVDTFTYRASDNSTLSNEATVTITVGTIPEPPQDPARRVVMAKETGGGEVIVKSGETGATLFTFNPYGTSFTGGVRVATGDITGDGVPDIITAPGPHSTAIPVQRIKAFDGVNGAALSLGGSTAGIQPFSTSYRGGIFVATGDLNSDGIADIIASAQTTTNHGSYWVRTINGQTRALFPSTNWFHGFNPYSTTTFGGVRVASGDVNGDGTADIITSPISGTPNVRVFNPKGTTTATRLFRQFNDTTAGIYVAAGDVNGDGKADIITSSSTGVPGNLNGHVKVFDGNTVTQIGQPLTFTGLSSTPKVAVGDIDGDGDLDLVVGLSRLNQTSSAKVYDATTLLELQGYENKFPYTGFSGGVFVAALNQSGGGVTPGL